MVGVRVDRDLSMGAPLSPTPTSINVGQSYQAKLGIDELAGAYDFDFYTFTVNASGTYSFDIDNLASSPNLPSQIQLYTINNGQPWFQLSYNSGGRAPNEPPTGNGESYMEYPLLAGTYFVVVGNPNTSPFVDPLNPIFRIPGQQGSYSLTIAPVVSTPAWLEPVGRRAMDADCNRPDGHVRHGDVHRRRRQHAPEPQRDGAIRRKRDHQQHRASRFAHAARHCAGDRVCERLARDPAELDRDRADRVVRFERQ
jgi:hypothetical protein